jgi:hypothetical protein
MADTGRSWRRRSLDGDLEDFATRWKGVLGYNLSFTRSFGGGFPLFPWSLTHGVFFLRMVSYLAFSLRPTVELCTTVLLIDEFFLFFGNLQITHSFIVLKW